METDGVRGDILSKLQGLVSGYSLLELKVELDNYNRELVSKIE